MCENCYFFLFLHELYTRWLTFMGLASKRLNIEVWFNVNYTLKTDCFAQSLKIKYVHIIIL